MESASGFCKRSRHVHAVLGGCSHTRGMRAISAKCRSLRRDKRVSGCWIAMQSPTVETNGVFETQVQGIGHQGMPNGNFV